MEGLEKFYKFSFGVYFFFIMTNVKLLKHYFISNVIWKFLILSWEKLEHNLQGYICYISFHKASLLHAFETGTYLYYILVGLDFLFIESNNHLYTDSDVLLIRSFETSLCFLVFCACNHLLYTILTILLLFLYTTYLKKFPFRLFLFLIYKEKS